MNINFKLMSSLAVMVLGLLATETTYSAVKTINGCRIQKKTPCINANLRGANLRKANLSGADLRGADLTNANLSGANLVGANLKQSNLSSATLSNARLTNANLDYARLVNSNLKGAKASGAQMYGADLTNADLRKANLKFADLTAALMSGTKTKGATLTAIVYTSPERIKDNLELNSFTPTNQSTSLVSADKTFKVTSSAFVDGGTYPVTYDCTKNGGRDISPPLTLENIPAGTKSLAITIVDTNVPVTSPDGQYYSGSLTIWGVFGIPPNTHNIPEGWSSRLPDGVVSAKNYNGEMGYTSTCPGNADSPGGATKWNRNIKIVVFALNYVPSTGDFSPQKIGYGDSSIDDASTMGCFFGELDCGCPTNQNVLGQAKITPILVSPH